MTEIQDAEVVESHELERRSVSIATADELSVDQVMAQVHKIQAVMQQAMKENEHYGVIPGTNKPTLLKPGAEKLCLTFRLAPKPEVHETWHDDGHYTVRAVMTLTHIPTGNFVAAGEGLCSTREAKYAYRNANRRCPACGEEAIIKGKQEYGGGWVCFKKKNGCGQKFQDGEPAIESQQQGRVSNPDLADSYNTVLKMACKRALVAAVLNGTAASDIFTQDIEDSSGTERASSTPSASPPSRTAKAKSSGGAPKEDPAKPTASPTSSSSSEGVKADDGALGEQNASKTERGSADTPSEDVYSLIANAMGDPKMAKRLEGFANVAAIREKCLPDGGVTRGNILDLPVPVLEAVATKAKLRAGAA